MYAVFSFRRVTREGLTRSRLHGIQIRSLKDFVGLQLHCRVTSNAPPGNHIVNLGESF